MGRDRIRVLHVDDHSDYVDMPASELERIDDRLVVEVVDTVADAVETLQAGEIDCIVTEYHLDAGPDQPVDRLRSVAPTTPVVLFTEADLSVVESAFDDGPTDYVAKDGASHETTYRLLSDRIGRLVDAQPSAVTDPPLTGFTDDLSFPVCVLADDEPVSINDALADHFDVDSEQLDLEALTDLAGREAGSLTTFLRDPADGSFTFEGENGDSVTIHAVPDGDTGRTLTVWTSTGGGGRSVDETILDSILEAIPFAVYATDEQGRYVSASEALPGMHSDRGIENPEGKVHHTAEDVLGKTAFDLYPLEHALPASEDDEQVVETEEPIVQKHEHFVTPGGSDVHRSTTKAPWYDADGDVRGVVGITIDLDEPVGVPGTEPIGDEMPETVARAIEGSIAEPVESARDRLTTAAEETADLDAARRSIDAAAEGLEPVAQLLQYSQSPSDRSSVDVGGVAREIWETLDPADATLSVEIDAGALADRSRLATLFEHLFENAIEHGGPAVSVTVAPAQDGFAVADDGRGVDPVEIDRMLDVEYTATAGPTGLGLPIVERIAESFGWELTVSESDGGGLRVAFSGLDSDG